MALTLAEGAKLSEDTLVQGVAETVVKESPVLAMMPFMDLVGNSLKYNRENALAAADFYAVGDIWAESTPTFTQQTATLAIMGGDADVDHYLQQTRSNINDIEQEVVSLKAKAMSHKFDDTFLYGDTAVDANAFDGLRKKIDLTSASDQVIACGASGATLTLPHLDQLIDAVKGGKPHLLLMSRRSRRKIKVLMLAAGIVEQAQDQFGNIITLYNGIPVGVSDWQLDTHTVSGSVETGTTGSTSSVIYALQFGEGAICGLHNGGLQAEVIGPVSNKNATRTRLRWYCSMADFSVVKRAALIGVQD